MSLKREVGVGLFWVTISTIGSKGLAMLRKLILARLLFPKDFGLVGYATLIIGALDLFRELGFSSALIYRKDDIEEAANTTFVALIMSSIFLYVVTWVAAPLAARFFRNNELITVLRVLCLTFVVSAISQVPLTLLAKGMGFKNKVIPEIISGLGGLILSVALAALGYGVWAIVYGQVLSSVMLSALVWFFCSWRPTLVFSWRVAKELWEYGKSIVGFQIMVFFITNIDSTFIGRFLGDNALGTYNLSYELSNLPATHLSRIVGQVMFPAFSKVQHDLNRLREAFFQSMKYVSLVAVPISIITIFFAKAFIEEAYGAKWYWAIQPLQFLAIYGLARSIAVNMGNVFKAGGKPNWLMYIAGVRLAVMAIFLYPVILLDGVRGVAWLSAIVSVVDWVASMILTNRIISASWTRYARILVPMLVVALITTALSYWGYSYLILFVHPFILLPLAGGVALGSYLAIMYAYDHDVRVTAGQIMRGAWREVSQMRTANGSTRA